MSEYTLVVRIPQAGNKEISYSINLSGLHESYPEDYFLVENNRLDIRQTIEQKSARKIDPSKLSMIISHWTADIRIGRHRTIFILDLPIDLNINSTVKSEVVTSSDNCTSMEQEQEIKQVIKPPSVSTTPVIKLPVKSPKVPIQNHPDTYPTETQTPISSSRDIRTDTNRADF